MDIPRRDYLISLSSGMTLVSGCLSESNGETPCNTVTPTADGTLNGDSTNCAEPANATLEFVESSNDGQISVTVTLQELSNTDDVALATTFDDEVYSLSEEGENITLSGFDESGSVGAFVSSCGSSRKIESYYIGGDPC